MKFLLNVCFTYYIYETYDIHIKVSLRSSFSFSYSFLFFLLHINKYFIRDLFRKKYYFTTIIKPITYYVPEQHKPNCILF